MMKAMKRMKKERMSIFLYPPLSLATNNDTIVREGFRPILDFIMLFCLVASNNKHIEIHSHGRKQIKQLGLSKVWKLVYYKYMQPYPSSPFVEETLKIDEEKPWRSLKHVLATMTSPNKSSLQCGEVMEKLKCMNGHVARNILKRRQSTIDRCSLSQTSIKIESINPSSCCVHDSSPKSNNVQ